MTVQPKNGEKPSEPMLIDTDQTSLCCLADDFLCDGDKVLIFQSVSEYHVAPGVDYDKEEYKCEVAPFYCIKIYLYRVRNFFSHARAN